MGLSLFPVLCKGAAPGADNQLATSATKLSRVIVAVEKERRKHRVHSSLNALTYIYVIIWDSGYVIKNIHHCNITFMKENF